MFSNDVKQQIYEAQNGYCKGCLNKIHSIHHKLRDTKYNRDKYPLFLNSPMNGVGLCYECHKNKSHMYRVSDKEAQIYEEWLISLIAKYKDWIKRNNGRVHDE